MFWKTVKVFAAVISDNQVVLVIITVNIIKKQGRVGLTIKTEAHVPNMWLQKICLLEFGFTKRPKQGLGEVEVYYCKYHFAS